jgi:NAD(P)-dependent dehydrogenase (short-subunit alcohol dehydrogenase family)
MSTNWLQLYNKTVIVTGAGSGIGAAIARAFSKEGCNVFLVDKDGQSLTKIQHECTLIKSKFLEERAQLQPHSTSMNSIHDSFYCDVTNKNQVCDMIKYVDETVIDTKFDTPIVPLPSILVNAAGITKDGLIHNISEADYDSVLDTNLKGTFLTCQAFCDPKRLDKLFKPQVEDGGGSIINIGSVISEKGNVGQTNYAASKGGVVGLTRALAKEMAFYSTSRMKMELRNNENDDNGHAKQSTKAIRVNTILPGFINTPMSEAVPEHVKERIKNQIPLKEFGTVDDIANMTLFLASPRSGYVTGTTLECSGMIAL